MKIPLAREGYPFIFPPFVVFALASFLRLWTVGAFFFALGFFVLWFFRDPERTIPPGADSIVSPADGKIIKIERKMEEKLLKGEAVLISVFMNVFNVHVNRAPFSGRVIRVLYNPGKFISANLDKASLENEQNSVLMEAANRKRFVFRQIAGLIARRIVCRVSEGDELKKGERIGMIRFGSRLDVCLPPTCRINVAVGEKVKAGGSILAWW